LGHGLVDAIGVLDRRRRPKQIGQRDRQAVHHGLRRAHHPRERSPRRARRQRGVVLVALVLLAARLAEARAHRFSRRRSNDGSAQRIQITTNESSATFASITPSDAARHPGEAATASAVTNGTFQPPRKTVATMALMT